MGAGDQGREYHHVVTQETEPFQRLEAAEAARILSAVCAFFAKRAQLFCRPAKILRAWLLKRRWNIGDGDGTRVASRN